MQRSPIDLPYIVYDPPTVIITLNSNTGIHVRYVPVVRYIVNSTEFQYISMHLVRRAGRRPDFDPILHTLFIVH